MRRLSEGNRLFDERDADAQPDAGPGSDALNGALARCADGDRQGVDELRAWEGGRLRAMLLRTLGEPELAEAVLEAALDDVYRNAGMLVAFGQGPSDDRVFALVRRHAYAALRTREHQPSRARAAAAPQPSPQRPTPPAARPPTTAPSPPTPTPTPSIAATPPRREPQTAAEPPAPAAPAPPALFRADEVRARQTSEASARPPAPIIVGERVEPAARAPLAMGVAMRSPQPLPVRRPGVRGEAEDEAWEESEAAVGPRRGRWVLALLAWIAAALAGFVIAVVVGSWLMTEDPPMAPPASAPEPEPAPPSARELLGAPIEAAEPIALPLSPSRIVPAPPLAAPRPARPAAEPSAMAPAASSPAVVAPAEREPPPRAEEPPSPPGDVAINHDPGAAPSVPTSARLFIHHSAGDGVSAGRARALAQRLQQRGATVVIVRPVPFGVRGLSVRYFHQPDRAAALAVLDDAFSLGGSARPPGSLRPTDFTAFQPAPRPGTIEIWLPGGT